MGTTVKRKRNLFSLKPRSFISFKSEEKGSKKKKNLIKSVEYLSVELRIDQLENEAKTKSTIFVWKSFPKWESENLVQEKSEVSKQEKAF